MSDHVEANRTHWNEQAADYVEAGRRAWSSSEPYWGIWRLPERDLQSLPEIAGRDVLELGCGTGYGSAWMKRLGARRAVGLDNSPRQLATAALLQTEYEETFPLVHADAERLPFASASFDVAISEYGACLWCDPHRWVPEAARVLRPGGQLWFLRNATLLMLCMPEYEAEGTRETLLRRQFGMGRFDWPDEIGVEFHLPHGEMISLLRQCGFEIEALQELEVSPDASTPYQFVDAAWASRWPSEEIWRARRRSGPGREP